MAWGRATLRAATGSATERTTRPAARLASGSTTLHASTFSAAIRTSTLASTAAALAAAASDARAASLPRGPDRVVLLRRL